MKLRLICLMSVLLACRAAIVADAIEVQPAESFDTELRPMGWLPPRKMYNLENTSDGWVYWRASNGQGIAVCEPAAGWVAPGGAIQVAICPIEPMHRAAPGVYVDQVRLDFDPRLVGDVDGDSQVTVLDVLRFVVWFGTDDLSCDFNSNGMVEVLDLMHLINNFGRTYGAMAV